MPVQLLKDIKVKCIQTDKFYPKNITKGSWYDVIAVNSWMYTKKDNDGNLKNETVVKFFIINDEMKITSVASYNCLVVDVKSFKDKKDETTEN